MEREGGVQAGSMHASGKCIGQPSLASQKEQGHHDIAHCLVWRGVRGETREGCVLDKPRPLPVVLPQDLRGMNNAFLDHPKRTGAPSSVRSLTQRGGMN